MGIGQSTTRRRVQPSLPYSLPYNRLSSSHPSSNSVSQPLLSHHMEEEEEEEEENCTLNRQHNHETTEVFRHEKMNADAALEKEIREIRSRVSSLESNPPPSKALVKQIIANQANSKKIDDLEKKIAELKSKVSKLESVVESKSKSLSTASSNQETVVENLKRKNADLEKKIMELTISVDRIKHHTIDSAVAIITEPQIQGTEIAEHQISGPEMNDVVSCLMILIFLISILIGIKL